MSYKIFALPVTTALSVLAVANNAAAQGLPVDTGTHWPIGLLFFGALILGGVLAYGIMRNRSRTRTEKRLTEEVTADRYRRNSEG